jgi:hypothetical protein
MLKEKIERLHEKLDLKDNMLIKKTQREKELLEEAKKWQEKLYIKDSEIKKY